MKLSRLLYLVLKYALIGYMATHNFELLQVSSGDDWYLPFLGLLGLDGGLIVWDEYRKNTSDGSWPRAISLAMIVVCLIGALAGVYGNMQLKASGAGYVESNAWITDMVIKIVWAVIGLNVAATIAIGHLSTTQRNKDKAQTVIEAEEEVQEEIDRMTIRTVRAGTRQMAQQAAPDQARDIMQRIGKRYADNVTYEVPDELDVWQVVKAGARWTGERVGMVGHSKNGKGKTTVNPTLPPTP